jgi:hypothetical protein
MGTVSDAQIHRNKSRDLEPPQRTSNRGTNPRANQSTGTKVQQNFTKSTIHIQIIGWTITVPSPWVWSRSTNTEQIHKAQDGSAGTGQIPDQEPKDPDHLQISLRSPQPSTRRELCQVHNPHCQILGQTPRGSDPWTTNPEIWTHHRSNPKNLNQDRAQQKLKRTLPGSWSQGNQEELQPEDNSARKQPKRSAPSQPDPRSRPQGQRSHFPRDPRT